MKKQKEKYKYIFPNALAKVMAKIDFRAQMESALLSQSLLLIGMTIMVVYMALFGQGSIAYKILIIFNILCGWVLISSYIVTTYQQYLSYMQAAEIDPQAHKAEIKKNGNIIKRILLAMHRRAVRKADERLKEEQESLKEIGVKFDEELSK